MTMGEREHFSGQEGDLISVLFQGNQSTTEVPMKKGTSLPTEKGTQNIIYCLLIVCENHRFQDPVVSYN